MKAIVIYDNTGRIWSIIYGEEELPQGVQAMWVDIPDGARIESIDVTDPVHPQPVFAYLPESDIGRLQADMKDAKEDIADINDRMDAQAVYRQAVQMQAMSFNDAQALTIQDLYPEWADLPDGTQLTRKEDASDGTEITIVRHNSLLYRVAQSHKKQADWEPGQSTASQFTVINTEHAGTLEDPIPAVANMEYIKGKYYIEDGDIYLMNREGMEDGEGITLQYLPSQLVGQYFEAVNK